MMEWISIKDRKPPRSFIESVPYEAYTVLLFIPSRMINDSCIITGWYEEENLSPYIPHWKGWIITDESSDIVDVNPTHWAEMPKLPKVE